MKNYKSDTYFLNQANLELLESKKKLKARVKKLEEDLCVLLSLMVIEAKHQRKLSQYWSIVPGRITQMQNRGRLIRKYIDTEKTLPPILEHTIDNF